MVRWAEMTAGGLVFASVALGGCVLPQNDSSRYREGIPLGSDVAIAVPRSGGSATGQAQTTLHIQNNGPTGTGVSGYAEFYELTRNLSDGVDVGTAAILGIVWLIVNEPATSVDGNHAVWGPWQGDGLDPVEWRFTATDIGNHDYSYELDGRPKASSNDADFRAILTGHGFGKDRPEHRTGWFLLDNDAHNALDPLRASGAGTTKVTYDLRSFPMTIDVEIKGSDSPSSWADVAVTHAADGAGEVDIKGLFDIETIKDGNLENVLLNSRWQQSGAGRSDLQVSGGDVPPAYASVTISECWSTAFAETYYTDTADMKPSSGDASSCAFSAAQF